MVDDEAFFSRGQVYGKVFASARQDIPINCGCGRTQAVRYWNEGP